MSSFERRTASTTCGPSRVRRSARGRARASAARCAVAPHHRVAPDRLRPGEPGPEPILGDEPTPARMKSRELPPSGAPRRRSCPWSERAARPAPLRAHAGRCPLPRRGRRSLPRLGRGTGRERPPRRGRPRSSGPRPEHRGTGFALVRRGGTAPPIISSVTASMLASERSSVSTFRPRRMTVIRSAIAITSRNLCEMNTTVSPASRARISWKSPRSRWG